MKQRVKNKSTNTLSTVHFSLSLLFRSLRTGFESQNGTVLWHLLSDSSLPSASKNVILFPPRCSSLSYSFCLYFINLYLPSLIVSGIFFQTSLLYFLSSFPQLFLVFYLLTACHPNTPTPSSHTQSQMMIIL
jgi:hypothetical protein